METKPLTICGLKDNFFSLKINKNAGHDDSYNTVRK